MASAEDETPRERDPAPRSAPTARQRMAELRALALTLDSQPRLLRAARVLRSRLPGDADFGDPLSTGGDGAMQLVARGVSALRGERESFLRELGLSGLQVWQSLSEATGRGRGDQALAILFTDIVGFSSWALRAGDGPALELLLAVDDAHRAIVRRHRGEIVKRLGDGVMATFIGVPEAVAAALDLHDAVAKVDVSGHRPSIRAGVHFGRPRRIGGDLLGVDVQVAARVADAAGGGQLLVSEAAAKLLPPDGLRVGRPRRLRVAGAPPGTSVQRVSRAPS